MKKILIFIFFPLLYFSQQKDDWSNAMQTAMKNIQNQDFKNAIINLDKSLKIVPNNWSALYFKGYSQIIIGEDKKGCQNLINSIFFGGNDYPKKVYAEKCINYDPKLNPQNFKTGKFTLQILDDKTKDSTKYEFERRNNVQYENFEGKVYSGKIIWYKNGDYTIIPTEDTEKMMTENPKFLTRILKIENNKYLYEKIEENQVQFGIVEKSDVEDWDFEYSEITDETNNLQQKGTYIKVCNLHKEVSEIFKEDEFLNNLKDEIERLLNFSIEKGIKISLNGKELLKKELVIFNDTSKPYFNEFEFNGVKIRIVAGLSFVGKPRASGWYIYCNDRLVLEADQSEITLWGTGNIPKWHVDYVMFKGIVFFDSDETIKLPLTTTKKSIDATSETYNKAKFFMREGMNSVLSFLKEVRKLGSDANEFRTVLGEQEDKISVIDLKTSAIQQERRFVSPEINLNAVALKNDDARISFTTSRKIADFLRSETDSKTYKELGEYLLKYYLKMEEIEYE